MKKKKAALISIYSNVFLTITKLAVGLLSGSVAVLSEAINSGTDIIASFMAFYSVSKADQPADRDHQYGHGKFENLSGVAEALLIVAAALYIVYEALRRAALGETLSVPSAAIAVMLISMVTDIVVSRYLYKVAKETDSIALEADAKHLSVDVYSSLAVIIGLVLVVVTGRMIFDSITALLVAGIILYEGIKLTRKSIRDLLDSSLPDKELAIIKDVLDSNSGLVKDYHELRTRKSGSLRHIDLHLTVCKNEKIVETHQTMDIIEQELADKLENCNVVIHPEPCTHMTTECPSTCYRLNISNAQAHNTSNNGNGNGQ